VGLPARKTRDIANRTQTKSSPLIQRDLLAILEPKTIGSGASDGLTVHGCLLHDLGMELASIYRRSDETGDPNRTFL
jgi:hypothetical protein